MRQFSIGKHLAAAALLPLAVLVVEPPLAAALPPFVGGVGAVLLHMAVVLTTAGASLAIVLAATRAINRRLAEATDIMDAIAHAELASAPALVPQRDALAYLLEAANRLAEVVGERQRRDLIHGDLDRSWQALRRGNLSNLAQDVVAATEAGIKPIAENRTRWWLQSRGTVQTVPAAARGIAQSGDHARASGGAASVTPWIAKSGYFPAPSAAVTPTSVAAHQTRVRLVVSTHRWSLRS